MSQLMLVNPKRKKRRKMTAKQRQYFGKRRRTTSVSGARNPKRRRSRTRRRASVTVRARRNPTARAVRRMRRTGSAKFGGLLPSNLIKGVLIPAAMGGAGAIAVDLAWGFAPLPANIKTGPLAPLAKIAAAIVVGAVASKVAGKAMGEKITGGYLTVMAYQLMKPIVQKALPSLPLADYDMGYISPAPMIANDSVGAYLTDDYAGRNDGTVGAYLNEYDNSWTQ